MNIAHRCRPWGWSWTLLCLRSLAIRHGEHAINVDDSCAMNGWPSDSPGPKPWCCTALMAVTLPQVCWQYGYFLLLTIVSDSLLIFTSYIHFWYLKFPFCLWYFGTPMDSPPVPSLTRDLDHFATEVWMTPMWAFVMRERCAGTSGDLRRPQGTTTRTRIGGEFWFPHSEGRWSLA